MKKPSSVARPPATFLASFLASFLFLTSMAVVFSAPTPAASAEVNVYSFRQTELVRGLFDQFTEASDTKVNVVYAKSGLLERLRQEGRNSPADVILSNDFMVLHQAKEQNLLQKIDNRTILASIPPSYRDPDQFWFALTLRARIIYASKRLSTAQLASLKDYRDLADPSWGKRLCTRPLTHRYNVGLIATIVDRYGEEPTSQWLDGVAGNFARKPQGNDRAQVKAIYDGQCDVAIGNSYYFGLMMSNPEQTPWAQSVHAVFPEGGGGVHVNISGMAMTRHAPNREQAEALMVFLVSPQAQTYYAQANHEYPARADVASTELLPDLRDFETDIRKLPSIATHLDAAYELARRAQQ